MPEHLDLSNPKTYETIQLPDASFADKELLEELQPKITELHIRHLGVTRSWDPSTFIQPVLDTRLNGDCDPALSPVPEVAKSSMILGYLTEEGLPYYTKTLLRDLPEDHPFVIWIHEWTAEEGRHGLALYGALWASGLVDMQKLESDRMAMMRKGDTPDPESFAELCVYPAPQEKATRLNHNGSGRLLPDNYRALREPFTTIAGDENFHFNFYNDLVSEGAKINPSAIVIATARQFIYFAMPGTGIPNYVRHAVRVSNAGVYGLPEQETIFKNLIEGWGLYSLEKLTQEAEFARDALAGYMEHKLKPDAERTRQRRDERKEALSSKSSGSETTSS